MPAAAGAAADRPHGAHAAGPPRRGARGDDAPLLPRCARSARSPRPCVGGIAFATTSYERGRPPPPPGGRADRPRRRRRGRAGDRRARRGDARRARSSSLDLYAEKTADDELAGALKRSLDDADLPPLRGARRGRRAGAGPRHDRGRRAHAAALAGRRLRRGPRPPAACTRRWRERLDLWRLAEFVLERIPSAPGRLPVPRPRPRETPRTSGCSRSPRCATSRRARRARARRRRCPSSSACWARRWSAMRALPGPPPAARAAAVEPRAAVRVAGDRLRAGGGGRGDRPLCPRDARAWASRS